MTEGRAFERDILICVLGVVDARPYLAATLAKRESVAALSRIVANAANGYADFCEQIDSLLDKRCYR